MAKYPVFLEKTSTGHSAHVPDLPGWIATGPTREETKRLTMRADGDDIPEPSRVEVVEVI